MDSLDEDTQTTRQVTVLGGGSWGTALAHLLGGNGHTVTVWDRNPELVNSIRAYHTNSVYLPNIVLPETVSAVNAMKDAFTPNTDWAIVAVSSSGIRDVVAEMAGLLSPGCSVLSATKGLEAETGLTISEIIDMLLSDAAYAGLGVLSGPNLAQEVVRRTPSVAVVASEDIALAKRAQQLLMSPHTFRVYTHGDVKGVELGGALKNVLAIGAGISDGLGFGDNTKAALMTRGLMEMSQIGLSAGAKALTFMGLAGVGDLLATSNSKLSRNYRVGVGLAQRKPLTDILRELGQVAEGVTTAKAALLLARRSNTETPLFDSMHDVIYNDKSPSVAVDELMSRPVKDEFGG